MNPGAPAIAALSGEPGIASVPAPRASPPDCSPVAVSRPVTGLSRASCRDASGLAVLMSTGRRAGLPGLSRPASRAPGGQARLLRITGPGRQVGIFSHRQLQRWAAGYREPRGVGPARAPVTPGGMEGRPADGHRAAWSDARPVPWAAANAPHLGVRLCSCGEAAKAAWALDPLQDCPRPPGCGCLPVTSTPCPAGLGCITGTRPSCSRQRPGECAAAGGLCAAEAQLRDPCS